MKKILLASFSLIVVVWIIARIVVSPVEKFKAGDIVQPMVISNIHGTEVKIPSTNSRWVHLQFRRFAGCPICNLHMHSIIQRYPEIEKAGIKEVVVFHSSAESLLPFQGKFSFDVIGDPDKKLYSQFGVGESIFSLLDIRVWPAIVKGISTKPKPEGDPDGGALGLPADFLIASDGKIVASHYGKHAYDQWSVDKLLEFAK